MAACALIGIVTTLVAIEPDGNVGKETIEREARVQPAAAVLEAAMAGQATGAGEVIR